MRVLPPAVFLASACVTAVLLMSADRMPHATPRAGHDMPAAAAEHFYLQRSWPNGIPAHAYRAAVAQVRAMEDAGFARRTAGWRWLNQGPVNIAGRIRAMALDPVDAATIYAGSAGGGVWKTTNSGFDWRPLDDLLPNLRIGAIAVDPFERRRILAGCGEGFVAWQGAAAFGQGIYRSGDGGEAWELLPSTEGQRFWYVFDVDFDPFLENNVLACTWRGVYRSTDGGESWTSILYRSTAPFSATVEFSRSERGVVYAALEGEGLFRSEDHGQTFAPLGPVLDDRFSRVVLAPAPSNGDILYAAFTDHSARECAGLRRSDDGGRTWRALAIPRSRVSGKTYMGEQGRFNSTLSVHPENPDIVWAGGIDLHRSTDGGAS
ncbi:MAG: hypothetical protein RRA94_14665, partial [Bacteroidota bacterium]|nr:hypothetical protein [Bacteroidota bacterium]